jgi:hypothetical protein
MRLSKTSILIGLFVLNSISTCVAIDEKLEKVLDNVRAEEKLYENIEILYEKHYKLHSKINTIPEATSNFIEKERYVRSGSCVFRDMTGHYENISGEITNFSFLLGFDGERRISLQNEANANISTDSYKNIVAPHILLLDSANISCSLSKYLSADDELKKSNTHKNYDISVNYLCDEDLDSMRCSKLEIETWMKGEDRTKGSMRRIWLAHDRNYLPLRSVSYSYSYSKTNPVEECRVVRFTEILKDIWYPMEIQIRSFDALSLENNNIILSHTKTIITSNVKLNPEYPKSFFRKIDIPKGTTVHIIKNGEIIKTYIEGDRTDENRSSFAFNRVKIGLITMFTAIAFVICFVIFRFLVARRKLRR